MDCSEEPALQTLQLTPSKYLRVIKVINKRLDKCTYSVPKDSQMASSARQIFPLCLCRESVLCAGSGTVDICCEHGHLIVDDKNCRAACLGCPEDFQLKAMPGVPRGQEAQGTAVIN